MKTAEDLLRRLLTSHFYAKDGDDRFNWSYIEGLSIDYVDPDLARDLAEWLDAQKNPTNGA